MGRIHTTRAARRCRTHALVLRAWRADILRGGRIGRTAATIDLPRRYRFDERWVFIHLFEWVGTREVLAFRAEWDACGDPYDRLTKGTHDEAS
jgi:hypothetical protein